MFQISFPDKSPVILTVSRVQNKMQRSPSISVGTPLSQRVGITAPQPVDVSYILLHMIINSTENHLNWWNFFHCRQICDVKLNSLEYQPYVWCSIRKWKIWKIWKHQIAQIEQKFFKPNRISSVWMNSCVSYMARWEFKF